MGHWECSEQASKEKTHVKRLSETVASVDEHGSSTRSGVKVRSSALLDGLRGGRAATREEGAGEEEGRELSEHVEGWGVGAMLERECLKSRVQTKEGNRGGRAFIQWRRINGWRHGSGKGATGEGTWDRLFGAGGVKKTGWAQWRVIQPGEKARRPCDAAGGRLHRWRVDVFVSP